jgi:hypothetical protein
VNEANRTAIVLLAAAWIVLMAVVIFVTWAAPGDAIEALGDVVQEMDENNDTAGRLVVTLGALALTVFALLVIILELAPEDEERELRVKQAGSTTIVPALALRQRLEEAIGALPDVSTVKAKVWTQDNGIATNLNLGLTPRANVANVTQEASRIVVDTIQTELGLPVAGLPEVRISFGGEKPQKAEVTPAGQQGVASSVYRPPQQDEPSPESEAERRLSGLPPLAQAGDVAPSAAGPTTEERSPYSRPPAEEQSPYSRPTTEEQSPYSRPTTEEPAPYSRPEPDERPPASPSESEGESTAESSPGPLVYDPEPRRQENDEPAGGPQS